MIHLMLSNYISIIFYVKHICYNSAGKINSKFDGATDLCYAKHFLLNSNFNCSMRRTSFPAPVTSHPSRRSPPLLRNLGADALTIAQRFHFQSFIGSVMRFRINDISFVEIAQQRRREIM